jgi:UDP-glucose 4-epimerase
MKILIIGKNSYIAKQFVADNQGQFDLSFLSVRNDDYKSYDYSPYDAIIYFAAIVHHPEITDDALYDKVNALIPYEMAKKAEKAGVGKFIYISTMAVFGVCPEFGKINPITRQTLLRPDSLYGQSKAKGETLLHELKNIKIQIVRLPNVYGKDCPGTFYHRIEMLARLKWLPIYTTNYKFSLISVENVSKALKHLLLLDGSGVYCPQDLPILSITDRIKQKAKANGVNQKQFKWLSPLLWLANKVLPKKYTNNLYGGYYIDPQEFPALTNE